MGGWGRLLVRVCVVAPFLSALMNVGSADGNGERKGGGDGPRTGDVYSPAPPPPSSQGCWIFSHMNKSGGESVKAVLQAWVKQRNASGKRSTMGWFSDRPWMSGKELAQKYLSRRPMVTVGGYTQGLFPYESRPCKWFTIFRHPVHRLVSAFFYCKRIPSDQLCATFVLDARTADLGTFAKHWGNFAMRQLLLAFVTWENVANASDGVDDSMCTSDELEGNQCPGWYRLKQYVESRGAVSSAAAAARAPTALGRNSTAIVTESWMHQFLRPAEELLSREYAAVGVLEQFDVTLALFNATLQMPDLDWVASFQKTGTKNSNGRFAREEAAVLVQAWEDPDIKAALWLDILLYDHAVGVFNRQAAEHGLLL